MSEVEMVPMSALKKNFEVIQAELVVVLTIETSFLRVREQGLEENAAYRHNFCTFKHA